MIELARKTASRSKHGWAHHACLVLRAGNIIAKGTNHGSLHAEYNTLNKLWPSERAGTTLVSLRFTKTGNLANAAPCPRCFQLLADNKVKFVVFSTDQGVLRKVKVSSGMDYTGTRYIPQSRRNSRVSGTRYYSYPPFAMSKRNG